MSANSHAAIRARALNLPADERLALATELLDSVEAPEDDAWAKAWAAELDRRLRAIERGAAKTIAWGDVKAEALRRLRAQ